MSEPTVEEVREALEDYERPALVGWMEDHPMLDTVLAAARLLVDAAEPDIEAATFIIYELRYIKDADEWDDKIVDITKRAVAAAFGWDAVLGIEEAPDGDDSYHLDESDKFILTPGQAVLLRKLKQGREAPDGQ